MTGIIKRENFEDLLCVLRKGKRELFHVEQSSAEFVMRRLAPAFLSGTARAGRVESQNQYDYFSVMSRSKTRVNGVGLTVII